MLFDIRGLFLVMLCMAGVAGFAALGAEDKYVPFEFPADTYEQEIEIVLGNRQAAQKASVEMTPLFNGYEWAISCRWDDNNQDDLKMRDVLQRHGHKATWYLNAARRSYRGRDFTDTARELLKGGNSIGGHSLTHPFLTYVSRNRIFEEVAGIRMEWEAALDTLVLSYAFSFCNYRNNMEGDDVQADITRLLERAGFYNVTNKDYNGWPFGKKPDPDRFTSDMILSPYMPVDGKDIDKFAQRALKSKNFQRRTPNLSYAMHVWYRTPEAWRKFEGQLEKYGHNPNWWYCNQNEYASYRYQFLHSQLMPLQRRGNVLRLRLKRPVILDVNYPTPLTFQVSGVSEQDVRSVKCATTECVKADRQARGYRFHLHHDRDQALPKRIGMIRNDEDRPKLTAADHDPDFPNIRALLSFRNGRLRLILHNRYKKPLKGVRIAYRLPLPWKEGVVRRTVSDVAGGSRREDTLTPTRANEAYKYCAGINFFVAQVDFSLNGKPGRLHLACRVKGPERDPSFPQGGFLRLGPIDKDRLDVDGLAADVQAGRITPGLFTPADGKHLEWQRDDTPFQPPFLDPELIRTTGNWKAKGVQYYLLQSSVRSAAQQDVEFLFCKSNIERLFLNGRDVVEGSGKLRRGENRLVLLYHTSDRYRAENAGCFLRVTKPGSRQRLTNIRFEQPKP